MDIFYAIEHGDHKLFDELIERNIDLNIKGEFGQTPLHLAIDIAFEEAIYISDIENKFIEPKMKFIKKLISKGANPYMKDLSGKTPIDWAKDRNNQKFLTELLEIIK